MEEQDDNLAQAYKLLNEGSYGPALNAFSKLVEREPGNTRALKGMGDTLARLKRYEEAVQSYNRAIELDPENASGWLSKGHALRELERYEEALQSYNRAIELDPKDVWGWISRGDVLTGLKRYEEALESYDKAIELDPENASGWLSKGHALRELERYEEALQSYNKAIELDPKDVWGWKWKGVVLQNLKRNEEALQSYDKAIELDPENASGWTSRGDALRKLKQYEEALESCDRAIELDPKDISAWLSKGDALRDVERNEEALQSYNRAIELDPKDVWGWRWKGVVLQNLKRYGEALQTNENAIELDPNDGPAWAQRGHLLRALGRREEALQSYSTAIKLDPKSGAWWFMRGVVLSDLKKLPDAMTDFEEAKARWRAEGDDSGVERAESWIVHVEAMMREEQEKREPPLEVQILRRVRAHLQGPPDQDPFERIKAREEDFRRYFSKPRTIKADGNQFAVLRRWNSYTPKIPREGAKIGGGYFLVWNGRGIVIDPGFDFMLNFDRAGYSVQDIDAIVLTHAHTDHTADLESLLCLKHEAGESLKQESKVDLFMNLGTMHKFIGWISRIKEVGNIVTLNAGDLVEPQGYGWTLRVMEARHSDIISEKCVGLVFELRDGSKRPLKLGLTSDTGWSSKIERQYKGCDLLTVHLGSIGEKEFDENLALKSKQRIYPQHLGLIGTISMVKSIKPRICVISEFGEELGNDRCCIAKNLDRAFFTDRRCLTGDSGLKIRLPDLAIYCHICRDYRDCLSIQEMTRKEEVVYCCTSHTPQDILDRLLP